MGNDQPRSVSGAGVLAFDPGDQALGFLDKGGSPAVEALETGAGGAGVVEGVVEASGGAEEIGEVEPGLGGAVGIAARLIMADGLEVVSGGGVEGADGCEDQAKLIVSWRPVAVGIVG